MNKKSLVIMFAIIFCLTLSIEGSEKRVRINREDVVGTWIGLTSDELHIIRLTLDAEGVGWLGLSFLDEAPCTVALTSWTFDKGKIALKLDAPAASCHLNRELRGVVSGRGLIITVQGIGWNRSASLRREEKLSERWMELKAAMTREAQKR